MCLPPDRTCAPQDRTCATPPGRLINWQKSKLSPLTGCSHALYYSRFIFLLLEIIHLQHIDGALLLHLTNKAKQLRFYKYGGGGYKTLPIGVLVTRVQCQPKWQDFLKSSFCMTSSMLWRKGEVRSLFFHLLWLSMEHQGGSVSMLHLRVGFVFS